MFKDDILMSLMMLHSEYRFTLPSYFVPDEENTTDFQYDEFINPFADDLISAIDELETDEEIKAFLNKKKNKKKISSILYAAQFSDFAFSIHDRVNYFSIEQPCRVLGSCIDVDFYRGFMSHENASMTQYVKDLVSHQELSNVVEIFADVKLKKDNPKQKKNIKLGVYSDRDMGEDVMPLYVYPEHFLSDLQVVQRAATKVRRELRDKSFYNKYESFEDYFEKSKYAAPLVNTILNDSEGLNFDEKVVLQSIAEAFGIRDNTCSLEKYIYQIDDEWEDVLDRRDEELNEAYKNIYQIDRMMGGLYQGDEPFENKEEKLNYESNPDYGYATADIDDEVDQDDNDGMIDEIILMYLENEFDVKDLEKKIMDVKGNRPTSVLYADHKSDSVLFEMLEDIKEKQEIDAYDLVDKLNEIITHLATFDEDKSLTKMSEFFIDTVENIFQKCDREYNQEFFKNSKRLYDDFRSFSRQITKKDLETDDRSSSPDSNPSSGENFHPNL